MKEIIGLFICKYDEKVNKCMNNGTTLIDH
jgi:hypothetical protein